MSEDNHSLGARVFHIIRENKIVKENIQIWQNFS